MCPYAAGMEEVSERRFHLGQVSTQPQDRSKVEPTKTESQRDREEEGLWVSVVFWKSKKKTEEGYFNEPPKEKKKAAGRFFFSSR